MTTKQAVIVAVLLLLAFVSAHADTISYSSGGTFSSSTPSSAFSGPSETWAFTFQTDTNPTVLEFGNGGFNFAFSDFGYSLGGSAVAITPTFIRFFTAANGGGFLICFSGTSVATCTDGLSSAFFSLPQMYTGTNSAPTLLAGTFTGDLIVSVNSTSFDMGINTVQATVPEPSSMLLLGTGLAALAGSVRRKLGCQNRNIIRLRPSEAGRSFIMHRPPQL